MHAYRLKQSGFTLLEMMVAMALGIFLIGGLLQVFVSSKSMSRLETSLSRTQEIGRYAIDTLGRELRMAGYYGCLDPNSMNDNSAVTVLADALQGDEFGAFLAGYETHASTGVFTPTLVSGNVLEGIQKTTAAAGDKFSRPGSDVIFLSYAKRLGVTLTQATSNSANEKVAPVHPALSQGGIAIVSNCQNAHIFQITNVNNNGTVTHGSNVNSPHKIPAGMYATDSEMMTFENRIYFVADTGRVKSTGDPVYALYVKKFANAPQELLEGVESLQIVYGMQLTANNTRYVSADDAALEMDKVVSVRLGFLVAGVEQVLGENDSKSYALPGLTITSSSTSAHGGDRAIRKPFTATVRLRNRRMEI